MSRKPEARRIVSRPDEREGGEEIEIAAQISLPHEGGWGWIVVSASFLNIFILDGVTYTFGSLILDIAIDLKVSDSLVALVNSFAVAIYFIASPIASAMINRFGFRACAMTGSVICCVCLFISHFITKFISLLIVYGVIAGIGYCLINMSSGLVVGFYFERLRSIALAISSCGSSFGIMALFPVNSYLCNLGGWRPTTLLHSGMLGMIFFLSMTFRPLLSMTVKTTEEDPTRTITYLPSLLNAEVRSTTAPSKAEGQELVSTATERLFSAISNANFPTAAKIIEEGIAAPSTQAGTSTANVSKLTLIAHQPVGGMSRQQLKQVQSIISRTQSQNIKNSTIEVSVQVIKEQPTRRRWWQRFLHWEPHVPESRPMYRDDVFYEGRLQDLSVYQKSVIDTSPETRTGLEYPLAVSRAVAVHELREKRGVFTTAVRRVLATMMDPKLLKKLSFLLLCISGFFTYLGFLVPYVYLQDRNIKAGADPEHCTLLVSAIGLSNAVGRLGLGSLAAKFDPLKLFSYSCIIAGISTIASHISYNIYYQYVYCCVFGFFIASVACLRSVILVSLYGLDKLTNATGMMLIFLGFGNLLSTPLAGLLKNNFGYNVAFCVAGIFITISGIIILPLKKVTAKENMNLTTEASRPPVQVPNKIS